MTIVCALLPLAGCATAKLSDDLRLKKNIVIDERNVSTMTVAQARAALSDDADKRLNDRKLTLILPNEQTTFSVSALGARYDIESALLQAAKLRARGGDRHIQMELTVDETRLNAALDAFIKQSERQAQNAGFSVDSTHATPVTYFAEQTGVSIDRDTLASAMRTALVNESVAYVTVPCQTVAPDVTLDSIQRQTTLVSQYTTSFDSKTLGAKNRVFNIQKAANAINGRILQPGDMFDCNMILGDRTEENGWRLAPGIRNGRYEDEYGGGVCQISSTLFNAVMMADLEITERHPHSWPMGYVEIGRDATISTGGKNFRFINSSGAPLTVYMHVDSAQKTVTASLYGKPLENGQSIDVVSEKTGTLEAAREVVMLDESLPHQTRQVEREARDGKTAATYKEYRAQDGTLLRRELAYADTYRAIDGLTYVSTDLYYGESDGNSTPPPDENGQQEPTPAPEDGTGEAPEQPDAEETPGAESGGTPTPENDNAEAPPA